jgi:hypothetical protein
MEGPYKVCYTASDNECTQYGIEGPGQGLRYYAHYLYPQNTFSKYEDAEKAARLMNLAFVEGERARSNQLKKLLGL